MSAARIGEKEKAVEWLLNPLFQFDDAGHPVGGVRQVFDISSWYERLVQYRSFRAGFRLRTSPDQEAYSTQSR
jgi:hypothetical protein